MPVIPKPIKFKKDPLKEGDPLKTRLFFKYQMSGDFYVRGAVAWPKTVPQGTGRQDADYPGFIIIAGVDLYSDNKQILIFDEQEFKTIDNWIDKTGNIISNSMGGHWYGFAYFANMVIEKYGCRSYYYGGQNNEIYQMFQAERDESLKHGLLKYPIDPIEVDIDNIGNQLINRNVGFRKFSMDENSRLYELMNSFDAEENNGVHALKCLFAGFNKFPYINFRRTRN